MSSWTMIQARKKRIQEELEEVKGEIIEDKELDQGALELYYKISILVDDVIEERGKGEWESVYRTNLAYKLQEDGYSVREEKVISSDTEINNYSMRLDIQLNNDQVILELKRGKLNQKHLNQLMKYMDATGVGIGFLIVIGKEVEVVMILEQKDQEEKEFYYYDNKSLRRMCKKDWSEVMY